MNYLFIAVLILFCAAMAIHDGFAYLLKSNDNGKSAIINNRVKRWHQTGVVLYFLVVGMCTVAYGWQMAVHGLLIRLWLFNYTFNKTAGLDPRYLGWTSYWDKKSATIFGTYGAVRMAILFFIIWLVFLAATIIL